MQVPIKRTWRRFVACLAKRVVHILQMASREVMVSTHQRADRLPVVLAIVSAAFGEHLKALMLYLLSESFGISLSQFIATLQDDINAHQNLWRARKACYRTVHCANIQEQREWRACMVARGKTRQPNRGLV